MSAETNQFAGLFDNKRGNVSQTAFFLKCVCDRWFNFHSL